MKLVIQQFTQITQDHIQNMSSETLLLWTKQYENINKTAKHAWNTIKKLDSNSSDERTLQLMHNYASGAAVEQYQAFLSSFAALAPSFATLGLPSPNVADAQTQATTQMYQGNEKMAKFYLDDYLPYKEKMDQNALLIQNQLHQLEAEISGPKI